jgi:hypothetical protein
MQAVPAVSQWQVSVLIWGWFIDMEAENAGKNELHNKCWSNGKVKLSLHVIN